MGSCLSSRQIADLVRVAGCAAIRLLGYRTARSVRLREGSQAMTSCRRRMSSDQAWRQAPGEPLARRLYRIVQRPGPRRMLQHRHLLVPDSCPDRHLRLDGGIRPPLAFRARLADTSPIRWPLAPADNLALTQPGRLLRPPAMVRRRRCRLHIPGLSPARSCSTPRPASHACPPARAGTRSRAPPAPAPRLARVDRGLNAAWRSIRA